MKTWVYMCFTGRERKWIREPFGAKPLWLPHNHSQSWMEEVESSVWERKVGPCRTRWSTLRSHHSPDRVPLRTTAMFMLWALLRTEPHFSLSPSMICSHDFSWHPRKKKATLTLLLTALMVVIVTTKDYATQLNNSLYSQSSCCSDVLAVCFQNDLQFYFIYLRERVLSTNEIIVKEMVGLIIVSAFKKFNQHFLLMAKGGWVKEEQKEESNRHI